MLHTASLWGSFNRVFTVLLYVFSECLVRVYCSTKVQLEDNIIFSWLELIDMYGFTVVIYSDINGPVHGQTV